MSNLDHWLTSMNSLSFLNVTLYHTHMSNREIYPSLLRRAFRLTALVVTICFLERRISAQEMKYPAVGTVDGHAIFRGYCAPCHGLDGKGHGPAAPALKSKVADLTLLSKRAKGEFPRDRVRDILEGKDTPAAHGSNEMPVWGPVFHQLEGDQDWGNVRVQNIVAYVETLQRK
jgi:mono/diheme cytochrome c family protein